MAVRYNGTLVQAAYTAVSIVDAKPLVAIDAPDTTTNYLGAAVFGGWAIDHVYPISYVQVSIDGASFGNAAYGGGRQDVCNVYPTAKSCPNVGYSIWVNTAKLAGGNHTITVTAVDTHGDSTASSRTFKVQQAITYYAIDVPSSSGTYLGQQLFAGWALDNAFAISSVAISIDGIGYGNAVYGNNRQDACNAVGNGPGCPNVGWSILVDTAKLSGGTHTFAVMVTTADGRQTYGTRVFTVQQAYTNIGIGLPLANQTYVGSQLFSGWALDDAFPISSVALSIDGVSLGNASYGGARQDVCNVYPGRPGCPNVGWSLGVNLNSFPAGNHTLTVTATAADGRQASQAVAFSSQPPTTTLNIGAPASQQSYTGYQTFGGWVFDNLTTVSTVSIAIDGVAFGNAPYGGSRPDVCAAGQYPGCPNVGWSFGINTATLLNGPHTFTVTATTADGRVTPKSVTFSSSNSNPTLLAIDVPQAQGSYPGGTYQFAGWALDTVSTLRSVAVAIDGVFRGNAAYGNPRTDVCGPGQYPGCSNVGWSFLFDTSVLAGGASHTFTITATTNDPIPRTTSASVVFFVPDPRLAPSGPSREYIYQNGKVIAIENHP